jgi:tRNA G18 (ribose-2'-O)-methylase SpoU
VALDLHFLTDLADPRLEEYRDIKDHRLRASSGRFVAESEGVLRKLLASSLRVRSVLLTAPRLRSLEPVLAAASPGCPIYVVPQEVMDGVAGLHVHRGVLAIGERPRTVEVPPSARLVLVLEDLVDVDNLGALVRSAAAFGADAIVLSPRCADPYYRKAIRVSMGAVFALPILRHERWPEELEELRARHGLALVGAVLDEGAAPLGAFRAPGPVALLLGSEGPGLRPETKALCDSLVTIPMARERADSLNVATAGAIFLYELSRRPSPRGA